MAGLVLTASSSLVMGMARDEDALREKTRCVITSACTNRGYVNTHVVRRLLAGLMESNIISAVIMGEAYQFKRQFVKILHLLQMAPQSVQNHL